MLAGLRVLLVEDEYLNAMLLEDVILEAGGEIAGSVRSNRDALEVLGRDGVDIALVDVNVTDGDTTPVLRHLREKGVPVMVCTGGVIPLAIQREGFDGPVYGKPVMPEEILAGLRSIAALAKPPEPDYVPSAPGMF